MKKYLCVASLFLFNNEIVSWLAVLILAVMGAFDFLVEMERGGAFK